MEQNNKYTNNSSALFASLEPKVRRLCEKKNYNFSFLVEGDWSNAAFWLCAGVMPRTNGSSGNIELSGLNKHSVQGDREICAILERMGARVNWEPSSPASREDDLLCVSKGVTAFEAQKSDDSPLERQGLEIDAHAIPDLIPVLCALAAVRTGETIIKNAERLRLKESDRLTAITQTLNALGAKITEEPSGLRIQGVQQLIGGVVDSWGDHRIAMMAAVASLACEGTVTITGAQAVRKSYPSFWEVFHTLGKKVLIEE
jgi:3-phosphoshikimate 1-carboxyvinyltransferase